MRFSLSEAVLFHVFNNATCSNGNTQLFGQQGEHLLNPMVLMNHTLEVRIFNLLHFVSVLTKTALDFHPVNI